MHIGDYRYSIRSYKHLDYDIANFKSLSHLHVHLVTYTCLLSALALRQRPTVQYILTVLSCTKQLFILT